MKLDIFPNDDGTFCIGEYGKYAPLVQEFATAHSLEDAQLIAAAPELLAALNLIVAAYGNLQSGAIDLARSAIAKAEGRE